MLYTAWLKKMQVEPTSPINYYLPVANSFLEINTLIGKKLKITVLGYKCLACKTESPLFRQGLCRNCYFSRPEAGPNIFKPELSKAHLGIESRDLAWEQHFELQPHVVYLSTSGNIKVGVTRKSQIPTRWIDQGANQAMVLCETQNRYEAGMIEVALKEIYSDKINYRKMLSNKLINIDLHQEKEKAINYIPQEFKKYILENTPIYTLNYPSQNTVFDKISIEKLTEEKALTGTLQGIKGQYLLFDENRTLNLRAHSGFRISIEFYI